MSEQIVEAVIAGVQRDLVRVHPLGRREPLWLVPRSRFDGQGTRRPRTGMRVHAWVDDGTVLRLVRFVPAEDPETVRRALPAALHGLARSMEGQVAKAQREGWPVPPVYVEVVERLRAAGELPPRYAAGNGRHDGSRQAG